MIAFANVAPGPQRDVIKRAGSMLAGRMTAEQRQEGLARAQAWSIAYLTRSDTK